MTDSKIKIADIGSISCGTLRPQDLLTAYCDTLESLRSDLFPLLAEARGYIDLLEDGDHSDAVPELIEELSDLLNESAPAYCYFGAHVGDGADMGFWPVEDMAERMQEDGVEIVADLAAVEARPVAIVNDHGNVTYGVIDSDGFKLAWAIV